VEYAREQMEASAQSRLATPLSPKLPEQACELSPGRWSTLGFSRLLTAMEESHLLFESLCLVYELRRCSPGIYIWNASDIFLRCCIWLMGIAVLPNQIRSPSTPSASLWEQTPPDAGGEAAGNPCGQEL